jgi:hypothetical protein
VPTQPKFEADIQDEIEFALIQMKAETLNKIKRPSPSRGRSVIA